MFYKDYSREKEKINLCFCTGEDGKMAGLIIGWKGPRAGGRKRCCWGIQAESNISDGGFSLALGKAFLTCGIAQPTQLELLQWERFGQRLKKN